MGFNHRRAGAPSAEAMLNSPMEGQVLFVARFIAGKREVVAKRAPTCVVWVQKWPRRYK